MTEANEPATQAAIDRLKAAGLRDGGVGEPVTVQPSADGSVARVSFVMPGDQNDPANQATVERFRSTVHPGRLRRACPASRRTSTVTRRTCSTARASSPTAPRWCFAFVLGLTFLLLLVAFRSIVIPTTAIVLNLLSTARGLRDPDPRLPGRLVRQRDRHHAGPGHRELRAAVRLHDRLRPLDGLPLLHPDPDQGGARPWPRLEGAVARGISVTAGTITSAAAIMVVVFSVFVTMKFVDRSSSWVSAWRWPSSSTRRSSGASSCRRSCACSATGTGTCPRSWPGCRGSRSRPNRTMCRPPSRRRPRRHDGWHLPTPTLTGGDVIAEG